MQVELDILQFHGQESEQTCAFFNKPYIKAISDHHNEQIDLIVRKKTQAQNIFADISYDNWCMDENSLSKRINKTANQCNLQEVLQECLYQIKQNYDIPDPTRLTYSNGLGKINNKWVSKNTGYTKGTYNDIPLKGEIDNLYALGSFTKSLNDQISTMNASIDSVAEYLNTYERLDINLFNQ